MRFPPPLCIKQDNGIKMSSLEAYFQMRRWVNGAFNNNWLQAGQFEKRVKDRALALLMCNLCTALSSLD